MPRLDPKTMRDVSREKSQQKQRLRDLMKEPFSLKNSHQLKALDHYNNHFELSLNKMLVFQGVSELWKLWGSSWLWYRFLPVPGFVNSIVNYSLVLGLAGKLCHSFNMNDFHEELGQMKALYNWALKDGNSFYSEHINNHQKLLHPSIEKLLRLLAPLCDKEELIAWPKVTEEKENKDGWKIVSLFKKGLSLFSHSKDKQQVSREEKLILLKEKVELGQMNIGSYQGMKKALDYFITSSYFRQNASQGLVKLCQQPFQSLRESIEHLIKGKPEQPKYHID